MRPPTTLIRSDRGDEQADGVAQQCLFSQLGAGMPRTGETSRLGALLAAAPSALCASPGLLLPSELHRRCRGDGLCRLRCYTSEMLVAACMLRLECCVKGDPDP
ncbi:Beta-defensin 134 [Galemys pyrenaicus]|uniref:Beta-defensin 134 n=1 Tax=Galemys pyrenaicus TaxID=202257 RepID=A0A8J5ZJY5_GALPY|nr:Beta-defensin 134 [Galemys pyrenaicus]